MSSNTKDKDYIRQQTYARMVERDTEDLLVIWKKADHEEWSDMAFDVIKDILLERLGEIPPQESEHPNGVLTSTEDETYHSENKLLLIASWANVVSWVVLGLHVAAFVGNILLAILSYQGVTLTISLNLVLSWLGMLATLAIGLFYFLLLQAISEGIYMLMDIEENSLQLIKVEKQ